MRHPRKHTAAAETTHPCEVHGCTEPGEFKAPASRDAVGKYQFLCLEHVQKFNQAWNYFDGWSSDEIQTFMHSSVHGHRPTWSVHHLAGAKTTFTTDALEAALHRMMGGDAPPRPRKPESKQERKRREALATLNLGPDADVKTIKTHYKMLVKKYHPDVNGSKEAEDTFKRITEAYVFLSKRAEKNDET